MQKRSLPTAYRKHGQGLVKQNYQLSRNDLAKLAEARTAFERTHQVTASVSIVVSLAIAALVDEIRGGTVRYSDDLPSTVRDLAADERGSLRTPLRTPELSATPPLQESRPRPP